LVSGLVAVGAPLRAALIESLPLNGTTTATVGTSAAAAVPSVPIVYVPDHYGNANGAVAFTPGTSPTTASYFDAAGGGRTDRPRHRHDLLLGEVEWHPRSGLLHRRIRIDYVSAIKQ
jgi:hypothetical protein